MKDRDGTFPLQPTPNWTLGQEMVWERSAVRRLAAAIGVEYDEVDGFILDRWRPKPPPELKERIMKAIRDGEEGA